MKDSREQESAARPSEAIFVYSTPLSILIFDGNLRLLQKIKAPENAIHGLMKGEWLPEEKAVARKAISEGKSVVILGSKNEKIDGVAFSQDVKKLALASAAAEGESVKLRELVISFTIKAVAASVGDDNLIIQSSSAISEMNKAASLLVKRLREWYELYCPEASRQIGSHEEFVQAIIGKGKDELLEEFKVKETMGAGLEKADIRMILSFAAQLKEVYEMRKGIAAYVEILMKRHCPNIAAVAGASTGAGLLAEAGSLQRLAMLPSSTIQLLGAEQALFKHLKDKKQRPPKVGVLHSHPLVTSAPKQQQGRVAKILADKISIASRVDFFKGEFVGDRLLAEIRERLGR